MARLLCKYRQHWDSWNSLHAQMMSLGGSSPSFANKQCCLTDHVHEWKLQLPAHKSFQHFSAASKQYASQLCCAMPDHISNSYNLKGALYAGRPLTDLILVQKQLILREGWLLDDLIEQAQDLSKILCQALKPCTACHCLVKPRTEHKGIRAERCPVWHSQKP